jgi:hypothetical protein
MPIHGEPQCALCRLSSCTTSPRDGRRTTRTRRRRNRPQALPAARAVRRPRRRPSPGWSSSISTCRTRRRAATSATPHHLDVRRDWCRRCERLKMLLVLTVCDIRGVGPGVWNGWKGQLLRTLYWETEVVLSRRPFDRQFASARGHAQDELRRALPAWSDHGVRRLCGAALPRLLAQGRSAAQDSPRQAAASDFRRGCGRWRPRSTTDAFPASPKSPWWRPIIRACCRSSPAPARPPAPISPTRRSSRRRTGWRSTRSSSIAPSSATRTSCGAASALRTIEKALRGEIKLA